MTVSHTFRKTSSGVTSFARVTVSALEGTPWKIHWADDAQQSRKVYGTETEAALQQAASALRARGRVPVAIRIDAVVETISDTKPDAVACAAAIAAWKAWACDESDVAVERDESGNWAVRFASA